MSATDLRSHTWQRPVDGAPMRLDVVRLPGEVVYRYSVRDLLLAEVRSPRPYRVGMILGDGTTDVCAVALFVIWCRQRGRRADAVAAEIASSLAGRLGRRESHALLECAMAEGLQVPLTWSRATEMGLAESLHDAGEVALAAYVAAQAGFALTPEGIAW